MPQLNLEFVFDRVILLSEGGLDDDTIPTNVFRTRKSRCCEAVLGRQNPCHLHLCDELGWQRAQIFQWQKQLFENALAAFAKTARRSQQQDYAKDKQIEAL